MKKRQFKEILTRIILVLVSVIICLAIINWVVSRNAPAENVKQGLSLNDSINMRNKEFALKNKDGFTDVNHEYSKPDSIFRIAVLGDSFIWGDGLPYEQVWSHKLEQKLKEKYNNIEVMHWGINGWQTTEEMNYYVSEGHKYNPDLLILGYVDNDPDMGDIWRMDPNWKNRLGIFYKAFPSLTDKIWNNVYGSRYLKWLDKLYEPENLEKYKVLLDSFNTRLAQDSVKHFYVLTPSCLADGCYSKYALIKPHLLASGFDVVEVNDSCLPLLTKYSDVELMANPSNYHPGAPLTEVFANETLRYLEAEKLVPDSLLR